jgi:hypothetical protein
MPEDIEKRIAELFRDAIDQFPSELRQFAEQWLVTREKAIDDIKEVVATLQFI